MPNKQCLLDPVPTWFLKKMQKELSPLIVDVVNHSFLTGYVDEQLKLALVRPLIKNPELDSQDLKSYRPVSNLPVLSKILEKVVFSRLNTHISANNLLDDQQSAYRKSYSTETALLKLQNDILIALDQGKVVGLVAMDISAAFDTVDHERLSNCFEHDFGITGAALRWLKSYLKDRCQQVIIGNELSTVSHLEYGFAQGAVLAGIFYNMYTSTLNKKMKRHEAKQLSYADDNDWYLAFCLSEKESAARTLQNCLNDAQLWMTQNLLKVNADKTKLMYFTPTRNMNLLDLTICFNSADIIPSVSVKSLGVRMDSLMTMEEQVNRITKVCYHHLRNIRKIRHFLDLSSTKTLVQALVLSRIDYCNSLLANVPLRLSSKLQRLMNDAA